MNNPTNGGEFKRGGFPFPLTDGPNEPPCLTWLRNHSNYMAVRGLLDYFRMVAVLLRGIFINTLVTLPTLLMIALVLSLVYGSLLGDWNDQVAPALTELHEAAHGKEKAMAAVRVQAAKPGQAKDDASAAALKGAEQALREAEERFKQANAAAQSLDRTALPITFFITKKALFPDSGWVSWVQSKTGLTPPFLLTPVVLALSGIWVLLYPIVVMLWKISGYQNSLATGSDSSVKSRDLYERSFGGALLVILAVALFEALPLIAHFYHQLRLTHLGGTLHWKEILAVASIVLGGMSGAPKLLSLLSGAWSKLAMGFIALLGLFAPLLVIVLVVDLLVFVPVPLEHFPLAVAIFVLTPGIYGGVIVLAILVGSVKQTFSGKECLRLFGLLIGMLMAHVLLFAVMLSIWTLFFFLYLDHPDVVPDVLLAIDEKQGDSIDEYGDLAAYIVLGCALEIWLFGWLAVNINLTSLHALYRDRLASAFLLGVNSRNQVDIEEDVPLSELCCHATGSTAPYHLVNVAINLQGSKDINLRDRQSDFLIFSKKFVGGDRTGYCRSATLEQVFPQIDLASAMAISAAAASPNMGRGTSPALVVFMTLINVRLGVWIPNPGLLEEALAGRKAKQRNQADPQRRRPGIIFEEVFAEELVSMHKRWQQLGPQGAERRLAQRSTPTPAHGLAGIGFSGGGIRSATVNLGIAQALHHVGIFDQFDYMSTVSGGGYLGASISTLMRNRTNPVSELAGRVTVEVSELGERIVTVTPAAPGEVRVYRYSKDARVEVKSGDSVKPGTRLIHRPGPIYASQIPGIVNVETGPGGAQVVRVSGSTAGETREYRFSKYDELNVNSGESIEAGHRLVNRQDSFGDRFHWRVRPSALLREMTMRLDETHRWVNLSDGGHIENLATIELLRRRCKLIVIGDGEADPNHHFNGFATLDAHGPHRPWCGHRHQPRRSTPRRQQ